MTEATFSSLTGTKNWVSVNPFQEFLELNGKIFRSKKFWRNSGDFRSGFLRQHSVFSHDKMHFADFREFPNEIFFGDPSWQMCEIPSAVARRVFLLSEEKCTWRTTGTSRKICHGGESEGQWGFCHLRNKGTHESRGEGARADEIQASSQSQCE